MKRVVVLLCLSLLAFSPLAAAWSAELGVSGEYWFPELQGEVRVDAEGLQGTFLDLETDLGMEDESFPVLHAFVGLDKHRLSFSYHNTEYKGLANLSRPIIFNGHTFPADQQLASRLEYEIYDLGYQYELVGLKPILAGFSLGVLGKVKIIDGDIELRSGSVSTREEFNLPIPMLGLDLNVGILDDLLAGRLRAAGMGYGNGTILDGMAEVSVTPFPFLDIHGGYRFFLLDVEADDVELDYENSGPYVGISLSF